MFVVNFVCFIFLAIDSIRVIFDDLRNDSNQFRWKKKPLENDTHNCTGVAFVSYCSSNNSWIKFCISFTAIHCLWEKWHCTIHQMELWINKRKYWLESSHIFLIYKIISILICFPNFNNKKSNFCFTEWTLQHVFVGHYFWCKINVELKKIVRKNVLRLKNTE